MTMYESYEVITTGDDANYDCTAKEIQEGYNNRTKPRKKKDD